MPGFLDATVAVDKIKKSKLREDVLETLRIVGDKHGDTDA